MTVEAILDTDILSEYFKGHNASVASLAASYAQDHGVLYERHRLRDRLWP